MKVIVGKECQEVISKALDTAFYAIEHTLGPKGSNAIVTLDRNTIVTNDGVSILKELELKGPENIPLRIIREACFNAEKKSGDGTTTSIILTHSIFNEGKNSDENKVLLLNEINNLTNNIINIIRNSSKQIQKIEDIENIATISTGGNKKLGKIIAEAFSKVGFKGNIDFELNPSSEEITIEYLKGLIIKADFLLKTEINYRPQRTHFLIYEGNIEKLSDLKELVIFCRKVLNNEALVLISNFTKEALEGIFLYNNSGSIILPYSISVFGEERLSVLQEAKFITNTKTISKDIPFIDLETKDFKLAVGTSKNCILNKNRILIKDIEEEKLKEIIEYRKSKNDKSESELQDGIATIYVGGKTKVEAEENLLRIEDAINSVKLALKDGIVIGGANLLSNISDILTPNNKGEEILLKAIKEPLKTIRQNCGLDKNIVYSVNENKELTSLGFNAETMKVEDLFEVGIIDPATTIINSLQSAVSIATALLNIKTIITED